MAKPSLEPVVYAIDTQTGSSERRLTWVPAQTASASGPSPANSLGHTGIRR